VGEPGHRPLRAQDAQWGEECDAQWGEECAVPAARAGQGQGPLHPQGDGRRTGGRGVHGPARVVRQQLQELRHQPADRPRGLPVLQGLRRHWRSVSPLFPPSSLV